MTTTTLIRNNPLEGVSVRDVRESYSEQPAKTLLAGAAIAAAAYWAIKSASKSGPIGAALKGLLAVAVMKKAKQALVPGRKALPAADS